MLPVIALVGRPNVGKSTLFNRLTKTRDALVASLPGLTRDRQYGRGVLGDFDYLVVDTGGLSGDENGIDKPWLSNLELPSVKQIWCFTWWMLSPVDYPGIMTSRACCEPGRNP